MPIPGPPVGYDGSVLLDDGTDTFPYDVSDYVQMSNGFNWNRGRGDELSQNQPGAMAFVVDNTDGRFTVGDATYGVHCDQLVRLVFAPGTPSQRIRFTGPVQAWPVSWPTGDDTLCVVSATAADPMATLARKTLKSSLVEEILYDGPAAVWLCNEAQGQTSAADLTGQAPDLARVYGTGTGVVPDPVFGTELGDFLGSDGVQFLPDPLSIAPVRLGCSYTHNLTAGAHLEVVFSTTNATTTGTIARIDGPSTSFSIFLNTGGGGDVVLGVSDGAGTSYPNTLHNVGDQLPHIVSAEVDSTSLKVFFDGKLIATQPGAAGTYALNTVAVGGYTGSPFRGAWLDVAYVNVGNRLTDTRVLQHHAAFLADFAGETLSQRIARVLSYAAVPAGALSTSSPTLCGPVGQVGRQALDVIQTAADADLGTAFVNGSGAVDYISGFDLAAKVTPDAVLADPTFLDEDTEFPVDMANVVNTATGQAAGSELVVAVRNPTSQGTHGDYPQAYTWDVSTDDQALSRTQWKVNAYAEPLPRCPTLKIDLLTMGDIALRDKLIAVDLGSFLKVTGLPAQTPGGTTALLIVEGIKETVQTSKSDAEWSLELNTAQRSLWSAFIPDDATYGVPDAAAARAFI